MREETIEQMKAGMAMYPMCREMNCHEIMERMKAGGDPVALLPEATAGLAGADVTVAPGGRDRSRCRG